MKKTQKDGRIDEDIPMWNNHLVETPPEKIPEGHYDSIGDANFTLDDIPCKAISEDESMADVVLSSALL